jgi:hypothetical protein
MRGDAHRGDQFGRGDGRTGRDGDSFGVVDEQRRQRGARPVRAELLLRLAVAAPEIAARPTLASTRAALLARCAAHISRCRNAAGCRRSRLATVAAHGARELVDAMKATAMRFVKQSLYLIVVVVEEEVVWYLLLLLWWR